MEFMCLSSMKETLEEQFRFSACIEFFMKYGCKRTGEYPCTVGADFHACAAFDAAVHVCLYAFSVVADADGVGGAHINAFSAYEAFFVACRAGWLAGGKCFVRDVALYAECGDVCRLFPLFQTFFSESAGFPEVRFVRPSFRNGQFWSAETVLSDERPSGQRYESQGDSHVTQFD